MTEHYGDRLSNPLLCLLELGQRARAAASGNELAFLAVNDSRDLVPYRQGALWLAAGGLHTLSGVVTLEANAPYAQWLDTLCRTLAAQDHRAGPRAVDPGQLAPAVRAAWDDWLPAAATWIALPHLAAGPAGLLLAGDSPLEAGQLALLAEWLDIWQHAWRAAHRPSRWSGAGVHWWRGSLRRRALVAAAVLAVLALPVRLTVLAPGELVPANPATIRAPLDGVIGEFFVRPNQLVAAGQPLFSFDQAPLGSRLDVAREALATARAEYRQAAQQVLSDPRVKGQLATLLGKIAEKQAQASFLEGQAQRSRVLAPRAGMVLFDDPAEWLGRPVQTGERIMQVAPASEVEIEAWLPLGDAIALAERAPLQLYLAAAPLAPLSARLRYVSLRATPRPDGSYAYRVRATLDAATGERIGLKGTAKLSGEQVPLAYWILRRPLASVRQFLAI